MERKPTKLRVPMQSQKPWELCATRHLRMPCRVMNWIRRHRHSAVKARRQNMRGASCSEPRFSGVRCLTPAFAPTSRGAALIPLNVGLWMKDVSSRNRTLLSNAHAGEANNTGKLLRFAPGVIDVTCCLWAGKQRTIKSSGGDLAERQGAASSHDFAEGSRAGD